MGLLGRLKKKETNRSTVIALESVSSELLHTILESVEQELTTLGYTVRHLELPTKQYKENVPALFEIPTGLENQEMVGLVAELDRCKALSTTLTDSPEKEVVLVTGGRLCTAAWIAAEVGEYNSRVGLYRWLEHLDKVLLKTPKTDLCVLLDVLPGHVGSMEQSSPPAAWQNRRKPDLSNLRDRYLEVAQLTPGTKIVAAHANEKLMPDGQVHNAVWNLIRRIALKNNIHSASS